MSEKPEFVEVGFVEVLPSLAGDYIVGVMMSPDMIAAGAEAVRRGTAAGASPEAIAEDVYFRMRQVAGDGKPLRRVR